MEQNYVILDYLKRNTGRSAATPDASLLRWNEFFQEVQCSVFDCAGRLLLLKTSEDAHWNICNTFCIGEETGREAILRLFRELFGSELPIDSLQYLRALKRRSTITDIFELHLPEGNLVTVPQDVQTLWVTEEEFDLLCEEGQIRESIAAVFHYREMQAMHYKNIYRSGWPRVINCSYIWEYVRDDIFDGVISLHSIKNVQGGPSIKYMEGQGFTITDNGYYWLQYAPRGEHFWLTVMFDTQRQVVQYYFDITYLNEVYWDGTAYFFDLFLDIVVLPNGHQVLLDEDELLEAYQSGQITKDMLDLAYREYNRLSARLSEHEPMLRTVCTKHLNHLIRRLEREEGRGSNH